MARRFVYSFALLMCPRLGMVRALTHDFSVGYVAHVGCGGAGGSPSSVRVPLEGSTLFWGRVLGAYIAGATWLTRDQHSTHTLVMVPARVRDVLRLPYRPGKFVP
jgi:hypothetical protein